MIIPIFTLYDGVMLRLKGCMLGPVIEIHDCLLSILHLSVLTQLRHVVSWTA